MTLQAVLFDIEGTILPVSFVAGVLFPAALHILPSYVSEHWPTTHGEFATVKERFPEEATTSKEAFISYCRDLNTQNSKFPPWKTLQGILWLQSYQDGSIKSPLFDDVLPALKALNAANVGIYIYSSGSIEAQKLLFAHTNHGDINSFIHGYFDPSHLKVENKFDVKGYEKIISQTGIRQWAFFSDIAREVASAKQAGMQGFVVVREGNRPLEHSETVEQKVINDGFGEILDLIQQ